MFCLKENPVAGVATDVAFRRLCILAALSFRGTPNFHTYHGAITWFKSRGGTCYWNNNLKTPSTVTERVAIPQSRDHEYPLSRAWLCSPGKREPTSPDSMFERLRQAGAPSSRRMRRRSRSRLVLTYYYNESLGERPIWIPLRWFPSDTGCFQGTPLALCDLKVKRTLE
ncbi:hypothetical protein OG21DRAFT_906563 [Imleria badia]|nr:hypothetical protein OG21DRAFT_906563 [Imleria badia]